MQSRILNLIFVLLLFILFYPSITSASNLDKQLAKAQNEGKVVMLQLGYPGCIPCDEMKPILDRLSKNYRGKVEVIFIDIKKDKDSLKKFKVYMAPTQVFIDKNGKEFYRHIGYYPYEEIVKVLKKAGI